MKKILFLIPLLILSCKDKEGNCNEVRTERTAIYPIGSSTLISATEWKIVNQKPFIGDCDLNNSQLNSGSVGAHPISSTQYIRTEYETKIVCQ